MRASFIHVADTHLGYEQYGVRERFNDFSRAFWNICNYAVERNVDFMVIAGDLFNKRAIDALTLIHAIEGLKKLQEKNIPVIAIEGNHDRSYYREGSSWLQFLCYQGYIVLLQPRIEEGAPVLEPWNKEIMLGTYIDLLKGQLRIYGLHWQGAATTRSMEGMVEALRREQEEQDIQRIEYRLLTMHTGIEGIVPRIQGLPSMGQFQPLHEYIDYLALGHVHKPYEFDGWIYNPGSTETCSTEEIQWDDRGYYYVEIDTDEPERIVDVSKKERVHHAEHLRSQRRPFTRYDLRVDGLNEPEAVYGRLEEYCRREGLSYKMSQATNDLKPLVQISLVGTLAFDAGSLDVPRMEEMVRSYIEPLYVRIDNHTNDQDYTPSNGDIDPNDRSRWHEVERHVFEELVARDNRYLAAKEQWAEVLMHIKQMALSQDDPAAIALYLREKRESLLPS